MALEILDDDTNVWSAYSTESWITTYVSSTAGFILSVPSADGPTWSPATAPATVKTLRFKVTDENSEKEDGTFYDEFSITFNYECSDDRVSIAVGDDITTVTHVVNDPTTTVASSLTHLKTNCDMTAALFYWDEPAELWKTYVGSSYDPDPVTSFSTSTGVVTIASSSSLYTPYSTF